MQVEGVNKPRVLVSVPSGDGWVHKFSVFSLMKMQGDNRVQATFIIPTHKPYVNNLHKIKNDFLKGKYDFWISFDDDNAPMKNPFDLVFLNKDIIGCPTPVWANIKVGDYPVYWNALDEKDDGWVPQTSHA